MFFSLDWVTHWAHSVHIEVVCWSCASSRVAAFNCKVSDPFSDPRSYLTFRDNCKCLTYTFYCKAVEKYMSLSFNSRYRVSTALRIVYWPSLSLLGRGASRSVRLFQLTIPPKVTICRESIIMLFDGKCNLVTRATLHNSYEFKVVKSLPVGKK